MQIIDGATLAQDITSKLKAKGQSIAFVLVGENPESQNYISMKEKMAKKLGVKVLNCTPNEEVSALDLQKTVRTLSKYVDGIIVQLPLPSKYQADTQKILDSIDPEKDIDALNSKTKFISPFIQAIIHALKQADHQGKNAIILARSTTFANNLQKQLTKLKIKTTIQKTLPPTLEDFDIIISALGEPGAITSKTIKDGAICIDAGVQIVAGQVRGDFNSDINQKASAKTPVPGGIGPLTIAFLFKNLINNTSK